MPTPRLFQTAGDARISEIERRDNQPHASDKIDPVDVGEADSFHCLTFPPCQTEISEAPLPGAAGPWSENDP